MMKFITLTRQFSRSEGGSTGANRGDSAVPYSPVPYSLPVQGPGPALLPAHPALLEARQRAFDGQELLSKDAEPNTPSSQGISRSQASTHETPLTLGSSPICQTPGQPAPAGRRPLPRDITNRDLCLALGTYLNYLPLVGDEEEEGEECRPLPSFETMESTKSKSGPKPEGTTPSYRSVGGSRAYSTHSTGSNYGSFPKGEEVLMGLGMEEILSRPGDRARNLPTNPVTGRELSGAPEAEEFTSPTPRTLPIPPRNPARLLRGHAPEKTVLAVSYRWQRRQNKRQTLAAGSNIRSQAGELSSKAASQKSTAPNSSRTIDKAHGNVEQDKIHTTSKVREARDHKNEDYEIPKDHNIGLGISVEEQLSPYESNNNIERIKSKPSNGNGGCSQTIVDVAAGDVGEDGNKLGEANSDKLQDKDIGLGINVYGLCEPFGHGDEEDEQQQQQQQQEEDEYQDLDALVGILMAAWKVQPAPKVVAPDPLPVTQPANVTELARESVAVESTEAIEETRFAGVLELLERVKVAKSIRAVDGSEESESPDAPGFTGTTRDIEATYRQAVIETNVVVKGSKAGSTLAPARTGDVVPVSAPLSVAPRIVAVSSSAADKPSSASINNKLITNNEVADEIDIQLETNYRAQAKSFHRKISNASAVRSRSTRSGAATSLRAPSTSSAPVSNYTPSRLAEGLALRVRDRRTSSAPNIIVIQSFAVRHGGETGNRRALSAGNEGPPPASAHATYGHRFVTVPENNERLTVGKTRLQPIGLPEPSRRGPFYFTNPERQFIHQLVYGEPRGCEQHPDCIECSNIEYAYVENKVMPTTIPPEERNKIIGNNRSLRTIKNELEALAETGAISDEQFDTIMNALPSESPLSGSSRTSQASPAAPPTAALNNMNLGNPSSPPAYSNSAPSLPDRNSPSKPELIRATALYRYSEPGDCNFEVGDEIVVYEYMNPDWWLGKNLRTGQEGVFPVNYVQAQPQANPTLPSRPGPNFPAQSPYHGNEKGNEYGGGYPQQQPYQAAPQGGPSNPYNSPVPPMQMADQPVENKPGRGSEMGKKFGKKLGNAAIFGAGATMGGDLVNKIF